MVASKAGGKMKPNIPLEFSDVLGSVNETEEAASVPDPVEHFFKVAELGALLGPGASGQQHAHNLEVEAEERNAAVASHYRKIAQAAARKMPGADGNSLAKRAGKTIEETVYPSGTTVVAELENGVVVKTYVKDEAA
jgi:hypothetical protein